MLSFVCCQKPRGHLNYITMHEMGSQRNQSLYLNIMILKWGMKTITLGLYGAPLLKLLLEGLLLALKCTRQIKEVLHSP